MRKLPGLLFLFLFGCNTTSVLTSWKAPDAASLQSFKKVIVVGLPGDKYNTTRQTMENTMVKELKIRGVNAVSSFELYGPKALKEMDEKAAGERFERDGADGALTVVLLDRKKEKYYTPGTINYYPYPDYYNRFWGYYSTMYDRVYAPGYYTTTVDYFLETNVYRLRNDKLYYSIQTKTTDPTTMQSMADEVSTVVIRDMIKKGMVAK